MRSEYFTIFSDEYGRNGRWKMTFHLPELLEHDIRKQNKIWTLICKEGYRWPETICLLDQYIPEWVEEQKSFWGEVSIQFQRDYRDPKCIKDKKERRAIKDKNDSMLAALKRAKKGYERSCKVLKNYIELKEKYYRE